MPKPKPQPTMSEIDAARLASRKLNETRDAEWMLDLLFAQAENGDLRARRMLGRLRNQLERWGARLRAPTWPPLWHPSRRHEIGL